MIARVPAAASAVPAATSSEKVRNWPGLKAGSGCAVDRLQVERALRLRRVLDTHGCATRNSRHPLHAASARTVGATVPSAMAGVLDLRHSVHATPAASCSSSAAVIQASS